MTVTLIDVDSSNWREVAAVRPIPGQEAFVADTTYYMCLSHYGNEWHSLAIEVGKIIVGHVMWAYDDEEASTWLGGLVIDAKWQRQGIGTAAVEAFLQRFKGHVALSYSPDNTVARDLYRKLGFVETKEMAGDELVARHGVGFDQTS